MVVARRRCLFDFHVPLRRFGEESLQLHHAIARRIGAFQHDYDSSLHQHIHIAGFVSRIRSAVAVVQSRRHVHPHNKPVLRNHPLRQSHFYGTDSRQEERISEKRQ